MSHGVYERAIRLLDNAKLDGKPALLDFIKRIQSRYTEKSGRTDG